MLWIPLNQSKSVQKTLILKENSPIPTGFTEDDVTLDAQDFSKTTSTYII
ncbi:MAG TPA: hypothetical protein VNM45_10185 [Bacillus sp. (in: firmicutes)]|nr:hypothetical protein [Bacillus sp. (in: firmicutes)]